MRIWNTRWQGCIAHLPTAEHLSGRPKCRVGVVMPRVGAAIAQIQQVAVKRRVLVFKLCIRHDAIVPRVRLEPAFVHEHALRRLGIHTQPGHTLAITHHMGFADHRNTQSALSKVVPHIGYVDGERYEVPGRPMTRHITTRVGRHS